MEGLEEAVSEFLREHVGSDPTWHLRISFNRVSLPVHKIY